MNNKEAKLQGGKSPLLKTLRGGWEVIEEVKFLNTVCGNVKCTGVVKNNETLQNTVNTPGSRISTSCIAQLKRGIGTNVCRSIVHNYQKL